MRVEDSPRRARHERARRGSRARGGRARRARIDRRDTPLHEGRGHGLPDRRHGRRHRNGSHPSNCARRARNGDTDSRGRHEAILVRRKAPPPLRGRGHRKALPRGRRAHRRAERQASRNSAEEHASDGILLARRRSSAPGGAGGHRPRHAPRARKRRLRRP